MFTDNSKFQSKKHDTGKSKDKKEIKAVIMISTELKFTKSVSQTEVI